MMTGPARGCDRISHQYYKHDYLARRKRLLPWLAAYLVLGSAEVSASTRTRVDSYINQILELVVAHRRGTTRLGQPAELTARSIITGGAFFLAGNDGWVAEGTGRAGGLIGVQPLTSIDLTRKGDVVWLSYSSNTYGAQSRAGRVLEDRGCLVIAFGPRPENNPPEFKHWVDSFTPWTGDEHLTLMGNVLSLWTLTAEVVASTARQGKTLAFWESFSIEGAKQRDDLYKGTMFHDGIPRITPVPPDTLPRAYLDYIENVIRGIQRHELKKILATGEEMTRRAAESRPVILMLIGHMMLSVVSRDGKLFRYFDLTANRSDVDNLVGSDGYFILLGYVAVPLDVWRGVRRAGARGVWIVSALPTEVDFTQFGDLVIDQHWQVGDCAVEVPGYDIRLFPPSGIAQLLIYELLLRSAVNE